MKTPIFLRLYLPKYFSTGTILRFFVVAVLCALIFLLGIALVNRLILSPPVNPEVPTELQRTASEKIIQLNILNASGSRGLAATMTDYLRARGFDVVEFGNYDTLLDRSIVIDRVDDSASTARVAYSIGIADTLCRREVDSTLYLRCTIIIGKDYPSLKPFR